MSPTTAVTGGEMMAEDALPTMGTYAGGAFHDQLPNGRISGILRVVDDRLRLELDGGAPELPLSGLQVAFGGAANRLIFFTNPEHPGWTFFTADRQILNDPTLNLSYGLAEQLARLRGSRRFSVALWLGALGAAAALIAALILGVLFNRDAMVDAVTRQIPPEAEQALGKQALSQLQLTSHMVEDPETLDALRQAAAPLLAVPGEGHIFTLHIMEDSQVNAFALPGGHIVFTTGLLLEAESAEEVLGVLAHEMAHSVKRHNMRQLVTTAGMGVLLQAFFGDSTALTKVLANTAGMLAENGYSREQEREADQVGFGYLIGAGIDPHAMLTFMKRQQQKLQAAGLAKVETHLSYLSTHPSFEERVTSLDAWMKQSVTRGDFTKVNLDYESFKARLRETLNKP